MVEPTLLVPPSPDQDRSVATCRHWDLPSDETGYHTAVVQVPQVLADSCPLRHRDCDIHMDADETTNTLDHKRRKTSILLQNLPLVHVFGIRHKDCGVLLCLYISRIAALSLCSKLEAKCRIC